ncbi:MAG: zinc ABC transporter substrate-binding protein [Candidatus Brocadiales bacterium]|nr:zinc ABC transporter substrate-binding protein [Candidatus Brocadiales bacterium]
MVKIFFLIIICFFCLFNTVSFADNNVTMNDAHADKKLKVVASLEFLAEWAKEIGQEYVDVDFVHDSRLDVHYFQPKPAHILMCTKADMVIIGGLDLDVWIRALLNASRNFKIQYGREGYVDASFGIPKVLQNPIGHVDMAMGDVHGHVHVHPLGNSHYYHNMDNVGAVLENIVTGLSNNDPDNADIYRLNKETYWQEVQTAFKRSKELMGPYRGTKVVTYHQSWEYFAEEFGLEILCYIEPKPGIPATPKHTKELIEIINQHQVKIILKEPYYPMGPAKKLMKKTGAKVVELVNYSGGRKKARTYLQNLEANIDDLIQAIRG